MADENKTNEEFLGDLKDNADKDPFVEVADDPFASSDKEEEKQPEVEETVEKPEEEEKPLPFHKDPKVQRYIEKEISKRIPEPTQEKESQDDYFDGVIKSFTAIIGNDTPEKVSALNALKDSLVDLDERAAQKAISRLESVRQEEAAIEQEYENKLSDGFETIEEETGIDLYAPQNKRLRVKFIDFVEKVAPKENGEISELPDIGETFKAFQSMYKPQSQTTRGKELASKSMERSGSEVVAPKETGRVSWDNVGDRIREKFGL